MLHSIGENAFRCWAEVYSDTEDVVFVTWATIEKEYDRDSEANIKECMGLPAASRPTEVIIESRSPTEKPQSPWRTARGVQLGTPIRQIERIAEQPFAIGLPSGEAQGATDLVEIAANFRKLDILIGFKREDADILLKQATQGERRLHPILKGARLYSS